MQKNTVVKILIGVIVVTFVLWIISVKLDDTKKQNEVIIEQIDTATNADLNITDTIVSKVIIEDSVSSSGSKIKTRHKRRNLFERRPSTGA